MLCVLLPPTLPLPSLPLLEKFRKRLGRSLLSLPLRWAVIAQKALRRCLINSWYCYHWSALPRTQ